MVIQSILGKIDHTLLKADARKEQIVRLTEEAEEYGFASVCVNPVWVKTASEALKQSSKVKVCTVIGFPLGATDPEVKAYEASNAIRNGAREIDMVINIGALKDGNDELVVQDITGVVSAAGDHVIVKVILETCLLSESEIIRGCQLAVSAGADFVKTSTGFSSGGALVEDVALMAKTVGPSIGVKASGGVRSAEDALSMIAAGATRLGTSNGIAIANGLNAEEEY